MAGKPNKDELSSIAREWAEFLFEEYMIDKQNLLSNDSIKEMVKPTYHEESK